MAFSNDGTKVFHFTLEHFLNQRVERDLDVVELFSGVASIHRAALVQGLQSIEFDIEGIPGSTVCQQPSARTYANWTVSNALQTM